METSITFPEWCEIIHNECTNFPNPCIKCVHYKLFIQRNKDEQTRDR